MLWINFLHFYQPANIEDEKIVEATERSYKRIVKALKKNPEIKFTFNITGCLLASWKRLGYDSLLLDIKNLLRRGQIELTGGAAFHAPLPLLPKNEIVRQIKLNEKIIKNYFGDIELKGFFSTEMMVGGDLFKIVKKMGYEWAILDEISAYGELKKIDTRKSFLDKQSSLKILFRSREYSSHYPPKLLMSKVKENNIFVTATDAELYGLRHKDIKGYFERIIKDKNLDTVIISEYLSYQKTLKNLKLIPSSWETTNEELAIKQPYLMWFNTKNRIHKKMWDLVYLAIKAVNQSPGSNIWSRKHLDKGLSSCMFWWASAKELSSFGGLAWSPDEIERGLKKIIKSIRSLENEEKIKTKAEKMYFDILKEIWLLHWKIY